MASPQATYYTTPLPTTITRIWTFTPRWAKSLTILAALLIIAFHTIRLLIDFRKWKTLDPSNLPHDFPSYLFATLRAAVFGRHDTRSLTPYCEPERHAPGYKHASAHEKTQALTSFLPGPLPKRRGQQAHALPFATPQRERYARAYQNPKVKAAYFSAFQTLSAATPPGIERGTSLLSPHNEAIFLPRTAILPTLAAQTQGEIAHVHTSDLSAHVTLSLADAEDVVAKGWGERHQFSGPRVAGLGYTLLYIPRTVGEVEVFVEIFRAAIGYMRSSGERCT